MNFNKLTLNARLIGIVGLLLAAILVTTISTLTVVRTQKQDSIVINLAGRQRMLSQKFLKEFYDELGTRQIAAGAEQLSTIAARQIEIDRGYYTKNVIGKLKKEWPDFKASQDYHNIKGAIPLPATLVRETSESLDESAGYKYELVSKFNINKNKGLRNQFSQNAWKFLSSNPEKTYGEFLPVGLGVEYQFAAADVANVKGCVNCHNNHPESPKKNFSLGDLMGILVITTPVTQDPVIARALLSSGRKSEMADSLAEKTRKLFETTMKALKMGGETFTDLEMTQATIIQASSNPRINTSLTDVEQNWGSMQSAVTVIRKEKVNSPEYLGQLKLVRGLNLGILKKMDAIVQLFQTDSEGKVDLLAKAQYASLGISLLIFTLAVFYISKNISRPLMRIINSLDKGSEQVAAASGQISQSSQQVSSGASEQAASLEESSSALEEVAAQAKQNAENASNSAEAVKDMATSVKQTSENSGVANKLASESRTAVEEGAQSMEEIATSMGEIKTGSDKITDIIEVINEITQQTKMLATNAAIEAARAGDQGKGFAVVADEVSKLAENSKTSAKEIAVLIKESSLKAQAGNEMAEKGRKAMKNILDKSIKLADLVTEINLTADEQSKKVGKVDDMVENINKASDQQANGVDQVTKAITQMDQVTQQNASNSEETASASEELFSQSESLRGIVSELMSIVQGLNGKKAGNGHQVHAFSTDHKKLGQGDDSQRHLHVRKSDYRNRALSSAYSNEQTGSDEILKVHESSAIKTPNEIPMKGDFKEF